MTAPLPRRLAAECLGSALLAAVVIGSGISAGRLSADPGLRLLENSLATGLGLAVLILVFGPVSGGHLNPVVSLADWWLGRRTGTGLAGRDVAPYVLAQTAGAVAGTVLANLGYALPAVTVSTTARGSGALWLGETVATGGLVLLVFALARTGRAGLVAPAVGAYIAAGYWFTSSTAFANPALTLGRTLTDTAGGIAPASVGGYVAFELVGAALGLVCVLLLYPGRR